jgi:16S rRNA (guanine1516-N2)-methyltransferase
MLVKTEMDSDLKFIVTTSRNANSTIRTRALQKATAWDLPYAERHDVSLADAAGDAEAVFVFGHEGLSLLTGKTRLRFSLGTAALRLQSIARGSGDTLVRAGELQAGDRVLDTTLGLGRDALVAARVVGPGGDVVGIESSWPLFALVSEGLTSYEAGNESTVVQSVLGDSRRFLASAEKASFDVVILDPMFAVPMRSDGSFEVLRRFADHTGLDPEWIQLARRVARRWVVVKTDSEERWFRSEKLQRFHSGGPVTWFRAPPCP